MQAIRAISQARNCRYVFATISRIVTAGGYRGYCDDQYVQCRFSLGQFGLPEAGEMVIRPPSLALSRRGWWRRSSFQLSIGRQAESASLDKAPGPGMGAETVNGTEKTILSLLRALSKICA